MHKVAVRHSARTYHHKRPHSFKRQVLKAKYVKLMMPLLLTQYKRIKGRPYVSTGIAVGVGLLSAALIWFNWKK